MNRILLAWERHAPHPRLPRTLSARLHRAGFRVDALQIVPLFNAEFDQDTYGNRMIDLIVSFLANHADVPLGEASRWAQDVRDSGARGEYFFSLNRYVFLATK